MLSRVLAGCVALAAFSVAIMAGIAAGNAAGLVLLRALMAMILCYPVGFIVGMICEHVIKMHAREAQERSESSSTDEAATGDAFDSAGEEVTTV